MKRKIKALEKPADVFFTPMLTKEASEIIDKAKEILSPHVKEIPVYCEVYYLAKDFEVYENTCDDIKCIKKMKKNIRSKHGKYKRITVEITDTCCGNERINYCYICGKPLNDSLTWVKMELENIELSMPWNKDELIKYAFEINCIFENVPSNDYEPSGYAIHQHTLGNKTPLKEALVRREVFYQRVFKLAEAVIREVKP